MLERELELEEKPKPKQDSVESAESQSNNEEQRLSSNNRFPEESIHGHGEIGVPTKHSGIPGATMNFVNSIIGAGIIGLPYALSKAGFFFGIFLMIAVAMMIDYGVRHLIQCGLKIRKKSYEETMQAAFGNTGFYLASTAIFGFAFGAMIIYHIVIGDTIPKIFQTLYPNSIFCNRSLVVVLYSTVFMFPLSLFKNMSSLGKTSAISFACVICIVLTVTIEGKRLSPYEDLSGLNTQHLFINQQWFAAAGTMAFAFVCHHNSFIVFNSLKDNTETRWKFTTHLSLLISVFWSMWLAVAGFFCFQTDTKGDILNNFAYDNTVINFTRGLLAFTMVFTYPMELFVARNSILQSLKMRKTVNVHNERKWFYFITIILWFCSLLIGAFISNLGVVLEIVGVVCGAAVGFIFPGLVSLRIFGWNNLKDKMIETYTRDVVIERGYSCKDRYVAGWNFLFPIFLAIFGAVIMIMGLTEIFLNI